MRLPVLLSASCSVSPVCIPCSSHTNASYALREIVHYFEFLRASLVAETVKNLPAVEETWVWSVSHKVMPSVFCEHDVLDWEHFLFTWLTLTSYPDLCPFKNFSGTPSLYKMLLQSTLLTKVTICSNWPGIVQVYTCCPAQLLVESPSLRLVFLLGWSITRSWQSWQPLLLITVLHLPHS